ncbi:hypothetical protein AVEN_45325-1 [Araneus ventricosus]|uniref:Uncharacterized protein n=1 Tax=Araneus ventricosus TaxID=182803 RepID=A0A4Y2IC47_ARAVE|nr:hypothetical protein AVEN_45325-1 [Araneus ventricosus]
MDLQTQELLVGIKRNKNCNATWCRKRRSESEKRTAYPRRWIGREGPITWPPRLPDPIRVTFLWGHLKLLVYATLVDTPEDLIGRIVVAAANIKSIPGIFERVLELFLRRRKLCNDVISRHFQQLL